MDIARNLVVDYLRILAGVNVIHRSAGLAEVVQDRHGLCFVFSKTFFNRLGSIVLAAASQQPFFDSFPRT